MKNLTTSLAEITAALSIGALYFAFLAICLTSV